MKKKNFISYDQSIKLLEKSLENLNLTYKRVPTMEALGYVLAEDIIAKESIPKFPTSSLDGFAIRIADTLENEYLEIEDFNNPAGVLELPTLEKNKAIKTFTGSPMPKNSDTLVPVENVRVENNKLFIEKKVSIGNGVRPIGEEYKKDEVLLKKGTQLDFAEIGILASLNISFVNIFSAPKVAIVSTGAELLELGQENSSGSFSAIRSSNNYTLEALFRKNRCEITQNEIVTDDKESIFNSLKNITLQNPNLIVTTGGVSVGDYDFTEDVLKNLGAEIIFSGVVIKPGQHILLAKIGEIFIVALPGFAYSSTITAVLYGLPIIKKFQGLESKHQFVEATLSSDFVKRSQKTEFTIADLELKNGTYFANTSKNKIGSSAILSNMINSKGIIVTKAIDKQFFDKDEKVNILFL